MKKLVADRTSLIDASGIRKVFALAGELKNPVNFSIGQPDFDVPEPLKQEAIQAIEAGMNRYSQTAGEKDLLDKISAQVTAEFGWQNPAVIVASGVSGGLLLAFMALVNPGDEVIIPDPYFVMYKHLVNLMGGKCVFISCYPDFRLPVDKIAAAITPRTKMIVLNSPCNPTGVIYSPEEIQALAKVAAEKDVLVLTDEIYERFSYDAPSTSIGKYCEKVLVMRGFSKSHAMTGWRLAYVAAPASLRPVIEEMTKIQQYTFVCAPTPFQRAAIAAMSYNVDDLVQGYVRKRDLLYNGLKDKFELAKPEGAFYAFPKVPTGTASDFVKRAIQNNVLVIPGNVFSERDTHFRISFATTDEDIQRGVEILCRLA